MSGNIRKIQIAAFNLNQGKMHYLAILSCLCLCVRFGVLYERGHPENSASEAVFVTLVCYPLKEIESGKKLLHLSFTSRAYISSVKHEAYFVCQRSGYRYLCSVDNEGRVQFYNSFKNV